MNFRTVNDLVAAVRRNVHKLPADIDLVVGVPRSGVLAACAVSLFAHKPFVDLHGFLEERSVTGVSHRKGIEAGRSDVKRASVLVVDDSIYFGTTFRKVRELIEAKGLKQEVKYAAVFGLTYAHPEVDIVLETCPAPRLFEWNVMNHPHLDMCCVDLDGVLCIDPTSGQNDDGEAYEDFLTSATLLNAPKYRINSIVTSRLAKYRASTEAWLRAHGIEYTNLFMLDLPSAEERRKLGIHASFKASVFRGQKDCVLFIESETWQARDIRRLSGKSVLAYKDMQFLPESETVRASREMRRLASAYLPRVIVRAIKRMTGA